MALSKVTFTGVSSTTRTVGIDGFNGSTVVFIGHLGRKYRQIAKSRLHNFLANFPIIPARVR
jgi:hypothetical protein